MQICQPKLNSIRSSENHGRNLLLQQLSGQTVCGAGDRDGPLDCTFIKNRRCDRSQLGERLTVVDGVAFRQNLLKFVKQFLADRYRILGLGDES